LSRQDRIREILQAEPVRHLQTLAVPISTHDASDAALYSSGREGDKVLVSLDAPGEESGKANGGRHRRWRHGLLRTTAVASEGDVRQHSASLTSAPLSPGGGTSTGLSRNSLGVHIAPALLHTDPELPASPTSWTDRDDEDEHAQSQVQTQGPLWRNGAIVRPPVSFGTYRSETNRHGRPLSAPSLGSASPRRAFGWQDARHQQDEEDMKEQDVEGGMDILEMLYHGPPDSVPR
jgi:hypothetical protein